LKNNFDEDFSVQNSAAFNTFECFRILDLYFPLSVTSVFSVAKPHAVDCSKGFAMRIAVEEEEEQVGGVGEEEVYA
jgi:hypothetical protein